MGNHNCHLIQCHFLHKFLFCIHESGRKLGEISTTVCIYLLPLRYQVVLCSRVANISSAFWQLLLSILLEANQTHTCTTLSLDLYHSKLLSISNFTFLKYERKPAASEVWLFNIFTLQNGQEILWNAIWKRGLPHDAFNEFWPDV